MPPAPVSLLLASNRGPVSFFDTPDGGLELRRGGGGLVSALAGSGTSGTGWVCAALTDADRRAAHEGLLPAGVRMLPLEPALFEAAYDRVANSVLWPAAHLLPAAPLADADWAAYRRYAEAFADAVAQDAAEGAAVLVQDYHLALLPALLRARRPDLRLSHFSHTPWAPPQALRALPVARELLTGMLGADAVGFLSPRWARAFTDCCAELLGAEVRPDGVRWEGRSVRVSVHPLGVDADGLCARAEQDDVLARRAVLQELVGDRQLLLRVDRSEPTKGIVPGLHAYAALLRAHPEHLGRVVHLVLAYPSRAELPEYRAHTALVEAAAAEVDAEFGREGWRPVHLEVRDDHARSLAAYRLADVLLVNPVRDGMNLVAKEGPVLSERGLALVLSREAGAADELGDDALLVDPHDVEGTAQALHRALLMPPAERAART
ncbi:MAG: alpha,alpha-trehalose-phosphate synthase, partial [Frankiales bacterium]|nr:alpha,alpha-trehalose-phosphate synthase [Frankiales bacterium]